MVEILRFLNTTPSWFYLGSNEHCKASESMVIHVITTKLYFENIRPLYIAIVVWFLYILHDKMIWSIIACAYEERNINYLKLRFDFSVLAFTWTKWNNEDAATDWILRGHTAYALSSNVYFPHMSIINFYLHQQ